jgi:hypothetical protein
MAIQGLPKDSRQAIGFAKAEFARGTRFWPRLLIRCLEETKEGNALTVVRSLYARRCAEEKDGPTEAWLHDL